MRTFYTLLFYFSFLISFAQTEILGTVTNFESEPIAGAKIYLFKDDPKINLEIPLKKQISDAISSTMTDSDGYFSIHLKKNNAQYIVVHYNGFYTKTQEITSSKLKIKLKVDDSQMKEIITLEKPVIYLYPEKEIEIKVKIDFDGVLTNTYPKYDSNIGWNILADNSGKIIDPKNNREYSYLYWEGISKNIENFDISKGITVHKNDLIEFLENTLDKLKFIPKESNDFISYWLPYLSKNEYNKIYFLINEHCDSLAKLDVIPSPKKEIRVYMLFSKSDSKAHQQKKEYQIIPIIESRKGYTLVEWGGAELKNNIIK